MNKKPDLIIEKHKIIASENTNQVPGRHITVWGIVVRSNSSVVKESVPQPTISC